jgi:hypothetical protein
MGHGLKKCCVVVMKKNKSCYLQCKQTGDTNQTKKHWELFPGALFYTLVESGSFKKYSPLYFC